MISRMETDQTRNTTLWWITSTSCSSGGWRRVFQKRINGTKVVIRSVVSIGRPLSGAGIRVDVGLWMYASSCLPAARALKFNFPILPILCRCFLQFLSTSSPLPSPLIRGTPKRWRIIPVRRGESFMSWEDTVARVLPAPFPLHRYLHQLLPSLSFLYHHPLSITFCACVFTRVYVLLH